MSGHSKWSTIKRKKEATDATKGKVFSKLSKAIAVAIAQGGGADPNTNYKLRMAIDAAKDQNMPKSNIERLLAKANEQKDLYEIVYEGFAPAGVGVLVDVVTDNKNRTSQEVKGVFDRGGGSMAGPGSVSFNFELKGLVVIEKDQDYENQMLTLIDMGVEDIEEGESELELYVDHKLLSETKEKLKEKGMKVISTEITQRPKNVVNVDDPKSLAKIMKVIDSLEDLEDVQKVYSNFDAPDSVFLEASKN